MKKRILVLLTAVAVMTAMLAVSVAPAFADPPFYRCTHPTIPDYAEFISPNQKHGYKKDGWECVKLPK
jgi:hypothetical protein